MSVADIKSRYQAFIIPDLGTIHHKPLTRSISDIHELLDEVDRLRKAANAYRDLSTCYRLGRKPNEKLFTSLEKARLALERP